MCFNSDRSDSELKINGRPKAAQVASKVAYDQAVADKAKANTRDANTEANAFKFDFTDYLLQGLDAGEMQKKRLKMGENRQSTFGVL